MLPRRFGWRFGGVGGALRVQLLKKLVMTLSGRYDGATIPKKGLP
jgi:hypothetical protein